MDWSEESIARLRALWQEGLSTAEIGRRMQITKNAVVGKAHRLDLAARPSPIRRMDQPAEAAKRATAEKAHRPVAAPVIPVATVATIQPTVADAMPEAAPQAEIAPAAATSPAAPALPSNVHLLRPERAPAAPPPSVAEAEDEDEPVAQRPAPRAAATDAAPRRRGMTCCWPLGEPGTKGFHFCGAEPTPGKPYCAEHAALAYVKLRDRRDSVA